MTDVMPRAGRPARPRACGRARRGRAGRARRPGPTPGTGLSRNFSPAIRPAWALLGSPLGRLVPRTNTRQAAGATLADLALGAVRPPSGQGYAALVRGKLTWPQPSEPARDRDVALWRDSAPLTGLPG
ncbi:hypothetical protein ACBI99_42815 [Nonomuraea sp. ATR24]|uniref:hypothetical protein n=1 Tax=Nonomuraea sp. ATR24 TaxID=1676744 RepID=UPI0035C10AD0